jgi:carboxymethylenebutenolidase
MSADILTSTEAYTAADGATISTYLARPAASLPGPGIVMLYEFWGMLEVPGGGPHMRDVAQRFARAGYAAAVPDYYAARGQQPTMEGGVISGGPPDEQADDDLCRGVRWLAAQPFVAGQRVGVIGWCGGGRHALFLAAGCAEVAAAVGFYGPPINRPGRPGPSPIDVVQHITCPVLLGFGAEDHVIPVPVVQQLEAELARSGVRHALHIYPEAGHAFMNDQRDSYNPRAASDAWQRVLDFFGRELGSAAGA